MLHLSKRSYCLATTLLMSAAPRPTYRKLLRNQTDLQVPIKGGGGAHSSIAFMVEDKRATENFITHTLAKKLNLAPSTSHSNQHINRRSNRAPRHTQIPAQDYGCARVRSSCQGLRHRLHHKHRAGRGRDRSEATPAHSTSSCSDGLRTAALRDLPDDGSCQGIPPN